MTRGQKIRRARMGAEPFIKQVTLAKALGVKQPTVSMWESGAAPISFWRAEEVLATISALREFLRDVHHAVSPALPSLRQVCRQAVARLRQGQRI